MYVGDDLENWEGPFECAHNDGSFWSDYNYWAPEVHFWKGKFFMFASFKPAGCCRGTGILCADSPMGPFTPHSHGLITTDDWECLDGTLYVSRYGRPYMVFCHEWVQTVDGKMCAVPLTDDLRAPAGAPVTLFTAKQAKWSRSVKHASGEEGYVSDGPFMWRTADGTLLILWASFSGSGYTEGLALSDNGEIDGNFEHIEPLFEKDGGHGMVFRALDGQLYMVLHSPNSRSEEKPCFYKITEADARLVMQ